MSQARANEGSTMKTYPIRGKSGQPFAVEVDVVSCSVRDLVRTIASVDGVTGALARKPFARDGDVRARFRFHSQDFAVVEPFGDNSRYWIGPLSDTTFLDITPIERRLASYAPTILRRMIGALFSWSSKATPDPRA
jgi:hypothetical protein